MTDLIFEILRKIELNEGNIIHDCQIQCNSCIHILRFLDAYFIRFCSYILENYD